MSQMYRVSLVFVFITFVSHPVLGDFQRGRDALSKRDYATAVQELAQSAEENHIPSQILLGRILINKKSGVFDPVRGFFWISKAAKGGSIEAQTQLGWLYIRGTGTKKDIPKGTDLVRKSAQRGHPMAQQILGDIYAFGVGLPKDQGQAAVWYGRAANAGNARAQVSLGGMLIAGNGVDKNPAEGLKWVKLAAKSSPGVAPVLKIMEQSLSPEIIREAEARAAKFVRRRTIDPANPAVSTKGRGHYPDDPIRSLTDAIDRNDHTLAVKIARDLPSALDREFVEWTKGNKDRIPPLFLYLMASRRFADDPEDALRWLYLGVLRASYDAMRCSDKTARSALRSLLSVVQNIAIWAKENPDKAKPAGLWALDHDERYRSTVSPMWVCLHGIEGYKAALEKKKWDPYVPEDLWAKIRDENRANFRQSLDKLAN